MGAGYKVCSFFCHFYRDDMGKITNLSKESTCLCPFFSLPLHHKNKDMRLRYYNLEIHQINPIHNFHKWGRSCQH